MYQNHDYKKLIIYNRHQNIDISSMNNIPQKPIFDKNGDVLLLPSGLQLLLFYNNI